MTEVPAAANLSPIKRALLAVAEMREKVRMLEYAQREPIAVIGIGCRFPGGADTPQKLWNLLRNRQDAITEVPTERWDVDDYFSTDRDATDKTHTRLGGFLDSLPLS